MATKNDAAIVEADSAEVVTYDTRAARTPKAYSSVTGDDVNARKLVYNAVNNAEQISDHLGVEFQLSNIIQQPTSSVNEDTGVVESYTRTTLITPEGAAYCAGSDGIAWSVENLLSAFGEPHTWAEPLTVKVVERRSRNKRTFFSIEVI